MNIHESVREYLRGESDKMNPVLCYTAGTDTLTVESGLSPHDGQIVLCSVEFAGNPLLAYDPQDDKDIERLALELIAESDRNQVALDEDGLDEF